MNPNHAKIMIRVTGTLAGLLGLVTIIDFAPGFIKHGVSNLDWSVVLFTLLLLVVPAYLIYLGYLVWFKFSPRAVQHVCGMAGVLLLILIDKLMGTKTALEEPWRSLVLIACLMAIYYGYKAVSSKLNRWLFQENKDSVQLGGNEYPKAS